MQPKIVLAFTTACLIFAGCGGGSSSSDDSAPVVTASKEYNVNIVDEPIIGATVTAPECSGFQDNGKGRYTLTGCFMQPTSIEAIGGIIDFNGNGNVDENETAQIAPLKLQVTQSGLLDDFVVSPLTTLAYGDDTNLTALANALGISEEELFNGENTQLQQAVNTLLISARDAGIVKYDTFLDDLRTQIATSSEKGLDAIAAAHNYMKTHQDEYIEKFGIAFGGFILDTTDINVTNTTASLVTIAQQNKVTTGKIKLTGFVYDKEIPNATVTLYDGNDVIASTKSDAYGRYSLEIDEALLNESKVFKLEAVLAKTKLISYITTQEIKDGLIAQKLSSANEVDLIVSNVTTAKSVLIEKTNPEALTDPQKLQEAKVKVEVSYPTEIVEVSAAIKDVVDNNKTIDHNDTLAFAQSIVEQNTTTQLVDITLPTNIELNTTAVVDDPMLSAQLNNNQENVVLQDYRSILEDQDFYSLYYDGSEFRYEYSRLNSNGTHIYQYYEETTDENNTSWVLEESQIRGEDTIITWSLDNTTLYVSGEWQPFKETLIDSETLYINNTPVHVYRTLQEYIGEPTQLYFDNFIKNSDHQGEIDFSSLDDTNKTMKFTYDFGGYSYTLGYRLYDDGTYQQGYYNTNGELVTYGERYQYKIAQYYGKYYIIFEDGQTPDGDGRIFYIDMQNHTVYKRDYHSIGFKCIDIQYDNIEVVNLWKNLTQEQRDLLDRMFNENVWGVQFSATYTHYQATQNTIYDFIKIIANQ